MKAVIHSRFESPEVLIVKERNKLIPKYFKDL